jgi:hypothetical protein
MNQIVTTLNEIINGPYNEQNIDLIAAWLVKTNKHNIIDIGGTKTFLITVTPLGNRSDILETNSGYIIVSDSVIQAQFIAYMLFTINLYSIFNLENLDSLKNDLKGLKENNEFFDENFNAEYDSMHIIDITNQYKHIKGGHTM